MVACWLLNVFPISGRQSGDISGLQMKRKRLRPSAARGEYEQCRRLPGRLSGVRPPPQWEILAVWEVRMSARVGSIEVLPERDRILVEERNKAVYSAEFPPRTARPELLVG
jgi:hypothetical protein